MKIKSFLKNLLGRLPVIRRFSDDEKGVTLVYVALSLPVILGFAGIGVDIAVWNLDKRESQAMADAAAMAAGVSVMRTNSFAAINATGLAGAIDNGFSAANGDTIVINNPPSIGPRSAAVWGDPDGDGISGDEDAIEVFIRRPAPALFSSIIMNSTNAFVQSRTVVNAINDPGDSCFMALDPDGSIRLTGGATVSLDCGAMTNGDIDVNGTACLNSTGVQYVDDDLSNTNCPGTTTPTVSITRPDPLRFLPEVEERGCDINAAINATSSAPPRELWPRENGVLVICNAGIRITPSGTLILHPGIYVFHQGASLDIFGVLDASAGVMIYFTEDAGQSNPSPLTLQAGGSMTVNPLSPGVLGAGTLCNSGNNNTPPGPTLVACFGTVDLSDNSMTPWDELDEIYEGIAFFQDRDAKAANGDTAITYNFTGGSDMLIDGVIYLPGGDVQWSGGSSTSANAILSDSITVTGNADFGTIEGTILETLLAFVFIKIIE